MNDEQDDVQMKSIEWSVSLGLVGCRRSGVIQVEGDLSDDDIDEIVRDVVFQRVEWTWSEKP